MHDPALGFVEGGYDEPTDTSLNRPVLDARQKYTHIVDDGVTQVGRGGIECALDGGYFWVAMYDITDGVAGAPRVFKREVQLPEKPLDGTDGYEFGTYVFDIDPVELSDYVGRELAVAVRHDSTRPRGQNWADEFPAEYGWGFSTGSRGDPLAETWQHELRDRGSIISAALFVEPADVPEGKARSVLDSDVVGTRSQTALAAFPEVSAQKGVVVQHDDRTTGDAAVSVLPNGVVEVGQGSSATDSVDVSVRDSEGTWYGPRTVTLTESTGTTSVSATGGTISPGESVTLSIDADVTDRVTVRELWTDWTIEATDAAGAATTTDRVSEAGEFELEWNTTQSGATLSVTASPPEETYVGGKYAVEVLAEGDSESATDTARIEIQSEGV